MDAGGARATTCPSRCGFGAASTTGSWPTRQRAPFPVNVAAHAQLAQIRAAYPELPVGTETGDQVGITGRVIFMRNTGKLCFATLREDGVELQLMLSLDRVGADSLAAWKADVDLGDLVFAHGEVISSKRGELSVLADSWRLTAKALRPLPVAHKPLSEEMRVRQRYVDLIVRPEAREMVFTRAAVTRSVRETMHRRGFLEVETPILQVVHGGAAARPFETHLNAFDLDMSLRIATELFLKRCIVGGIDKVYEMGQVFRNEGVDSTHSPEFMVLEAYEAYGDYDTMAELTRGIVLDAAAAVEVSTAGHAGRSRNRPGRGMAQRVNSRPGFRSGRRGNYRRHRGRPNCVGTRNASASRCTMSWSPEKLFWNCTKSLSSTP